MEQYLHVEGAGAPGHGQADPAEPEHAEATPAQAIEAGRPVVAPVAERVLAQAVVIAVDAAPERQQQGHGVVGHLGGAVVRHDRDGDAPRAETRQVQAVVADAAANDNPAVLQPVDRLGDGGGRAIGDDGIRRLPRGVGHIGRVVIDVERHLRSGDRSLDLEVVVKVPVRQQNSHLRHTFLPSCSGILATFASGF